MTEMTVTANRGQYEIRRSGKKAPTMSSIFAAHPDLPSSLRQLLDPSHSEGSLIMISGYAGNGKTTLARTLIEDVVSNHGPDDRVPVAHIGFQEYLLPEGAAARYIDEEGACLSSERFQEKIAVFDEVRTPQRAFEAITLAVAGVKVIAVLHATGPDLAIDRLRALLRSFGIGESFLNGLISKDRIISIWQDLSYLEV